MPTNKGKFKKLTQRPKKAGSHRHISATTVQDLNLTIEEEAAPSQDELSQKIQAMMRMLADLSNRVKATEDQQREVVVSPTVSPSSSHPIRS